MTRKIYSPAELCELFDVAKTTLFRWEQEDWFPRVPRDLKGERQYSHEHIKAISDRHVEKLTSQYDEAARSEDKARMWEIQRRVDMLRAIQGDIISVRHLVEAGHVSPADTRQLVRMAYERYDPTEPEFYSFLEEVLETKAQLEQV